MRLGYNKRLAAGLVLAGVLLVAFCLGAEGYIARESQVMLDEVWPLAESVQAGDWQGAGVRLGDLLGHWQGARRVWLGLLSHREVWNLDEVMLRLSVQVEEQQVEGAREELALVQYYLERANLSDEVNWSNFF